MRKLIVMVAVMIFTACAGGDKPASGSSGVTAQAASVQQMRFHCDSDTAAINSLLQLGAESRLSDGGKLMMFYAKQLIGTPYVAHTLEGDSEQLTINIHQLDCTTFVETLYALTRATLSRQLSWRDYAHYLENVRYRHGTMGDYATRLHYMSEWLIDNVARGNIVELTPEFSGTKYKVKTIDFMSTHRDSYPSLASDSIYDKIKSVEMGFRNHRFPYLPKGQLASKAVRAELRDGDMVGLVTNIDGLDISHLGIISKDDEGNIYLLDASMRGKQVQLEAKPLHQYLSGSKSTTIGVRLWRIKQ